MQLWTANHDYHEVRETKIQLEMESQIMESNVRTKCVKSRAVFAIIPKTLFQDVGGCLGARSYDTDPRRSVA
jgi:hypothetical protein